MKIFIFSGIEYLYDKTFSNSILVVIEEDLKKAAELIKKHPRKINVSKEDFEKVREFELKDEKILPELFFGDEF